MIFKSFNNIVCQSAKVARVPWANRLDLIRKVDCTASPQLSLLGQRGVKGDLGGGRMRGMGDGRSDMVYSSHAC